MCKGGICTPCELNSGLCDQWANEVFERLTEMGIDAEIWSTVWERSYADHMFVKIGSKFYDAENIDGVDDYMELPFFQRSFAKRGVREPVHRII